LYQDCVPERRRAECDQLFRPGNVEVVGIPAMTVLLSVRFFFCSFHDWRCFRNTEHELSDSFPLSPVGLVMRLPN
jgi:hypothetical protein